MENPIYHDLPGMEWRACYAYKKGGDYYEGRVIVKADNLMDASIRVGEVVSQMAAQNEWKEFLISDLNLMGEPGSDCFDPIF